MIAANVFVTSIFWIKKQSKCIKLSLFCGFYGLSIIMALLSVSLASFVPAIRDILFPTVTDIIQFIVYVMTYVTVCIVAPFLFKADTTSRGETISLT